ncbi:MAG: preprotein translocase subunit SecE [Planctomycetes bacterium]|nr:preprotein translocase subunit SecE [Planctomycetota bacterium]
MTWAYYKPGQGNIARWTAAGVLVLFALFGCVTFYYFVQGIVSVPVTLSVRPDTDPAELVGQTSSDDLSDPGAPDAPPFVRRGEDLDEDVAKRILLLAQSGQIREVTLEGKTWWTGVPGGSEALEAAGVTWGALFCALLGVVLCLVIYQFVVIRPSVAEFLIETEIEFRRVSWPAKPEYLGSSFVVILSVVFLAMFLFVTDQVWFRVLDVIRW